MITKAKAQIDIATAKAKAQMQANVQAARAECKAKLSQVVKDEKAQGRTNHGKNKA